MRKLSKLENALFRLGALLTTLGAATYLFGGWWSVAAYAVGTLFFAAMQMRASYDGHNFVLARLRRQQLIGAALMVVSAVAMVSQALGHNLVQHNEWVVCLLIGAMLQFYTALRIPQEIEKEKR